MSFDPITLALAKKYTDEKVGSGGGSGGGLPVVELTTQPTSDGSALTAEESAALDAAAAGGTPIVLKFMVSDGAVCLVANASGPAFDSIMSFTARDPAYDVMLFNTGDGWMAMVTVIS